MGVVLLARQISLDRPAVLKRIRRDLTDFPDLARRFEREARAAAQIHHHNVVVVYDHFSWRSDQFIAQEFVDGIDLASALTRTGPLPWRIATLIALEVSRGLEEIHALGTVHRDVKPANILLGRRGEVKIADFGLALEATGSSLTEPGVMIGSPTYMPPEQMLGERVDARSDVFSLGVILYEMLAGHPPYPQAPAEPEPAEAEPEQAERPAESLLGRMQKERYRRIRRAAKGTPRPLARLIRRCLRAKPRHRLGSAAELRKALEAWLHAPSPADVRAELATWLWSRQLFELRQNETIVQLAPTAPARTRRTPRFATAALVASLVAVAAATFWAIDYRPLANLRGAAGFELPGWAAPFAHLNPRATETESAEPKATPASRQADTEPASP